MKRLLSFILCLTMLMSLAPAVSYAAGSSSVVPCALTEGCTLPEGHPGECQSAVGDSLGSGEIEHAAAAMGDFGDTAPAGSEPVTPTEAESFDSAALSLSFTGCDRVSEDGSGYYTFYAAVDQVNNIPVTAESSGALSYCWEKYDSANLVYVPLDPVDNSSALSSSLGLTVDIYMLDVYDLYRCAVTASLNGETMTRYAYFTLKGQAETSEEAAEAASEEEVLCSGTLELYQQGGLPRPPEAEAPTMMLFFFAAANDAESAIRDGLSLASYSSTIYLSTYSITADELKETVQDVVNSSPMLFYLGANYNFYTNSSGFVTRFLPTYTMSKAEASAATEQIEAEISGILSYVYEGMDAGMDAVGAMLAVNDYFATHYQYDKSYQNYDIYDLFVSKTAVCQAYALGYQEVLTRLGLQCETVVSIKMDHMWNLVCPDPDSGSWYHVDVTWNDPTNDLLGRACHDYFLVSDSAIGDSSRGVAHHDYEANHTATDATYDSRFWYGVDTPFAFVDGSWYYVAAPSAGVGGYPNIYSGSPATGETELVKSCGFTWSAASGGYSGCGEYMGGVLVNSGSAFYKYVPSTGALSQIAGVDTASGNILASYVSGNRIAYGFGSSLASLSEKSIKPVSISAYNDKLLVGGSMQMSADISGSIVWSVINGTGSATISDGGLLSAVSAGTVTVRATSADDGSLTGDREMTLLPQDDGVPAESITVSTPSYQVIAGDSLPLTASVLPADATNPALTWSITSGSDCASIDQNGLLSATAPGTVQITASASDGSGVTGSVTISVIRMVTDITVSADASSLVMSSEGPDTMQMSADLLPEDASDKSVTWSVINGSGSATISGEGLVTATAPGTVTVRATAKDGSGIYGETELTIQTRYAVGVTVDPPSAPVTAGGSLQLSATVTPADALDKSLSWSLVSGDCAEISAEGLLTCIAPGVVTVRATAGNGIYGEATVEIVEYGVAITGADAVTSGKSVRLTGAFTPSNLTNTRIAWSLAEGDAQYATLSPSGNYATVTAKTVTERHTVTLTASAADGSAKAAVKTITVVPRVQTVAISDKTGDVTGQTLLMDIHDADSHSVTGATLQLSAATLPSDAADDVTWTSSSPSVASVSADGLVTGLKPGTVTIKATAKDGSGRYASVKLRVIYAEAATSLTAAASADKPIPSIGLQSGYSTGIQIFGADKASPLDPELFTYASSSADIASVDPDTGLIVAGSKPGTATVTATMKNDPLNRRASLRVKVIALQADSVMLTPVLPDGAAAVSGPVDGRYTLVFDKAALGTGSTPYTFTITPTATVTAADGSESTQSVAMSYVSGDTSIATVTAASDGTATVSVKRTASATGECAITGTSKDLAKKSNILSISVRDYTPRIGSASLTLNPMLGSGVSTPLLSSYGNAIHSVALYELNSATGAYDIPSTRLMASFAEDVLTIVPIGTVGNASVKAQLRAVCDRGESVVPVTVTVRSVEPSISVKQSARFNLFYSDSEAVLTASARGYTVTGIQLESHSVFEGVCDTVRSPGSISVSYKDDPVYNARPNVSLTLLISIEGYTQPVRKTVTLSTVTEKPSLSLSLASSTINTAIGERCVSFTVYDRTNKRTLSLDAGAASYDSAFASAQNTGDTVTLTLKGTDGGTANINVQNRSWLQPVTLSHRVSVQTGLPTARLAASSLTLNSVYPDIPASAKMTLSQTGLSISTAAAPLVVSTAAEGTETRTEANKLSFTYETDSDGSVLLVARINDGSVKAGTYSYTVTPSLTTRAALSAVSLRVSVARTLPTARLSATTLKLSNVYSAAPATATVTLSRNELPLSTATRIASTAGAGTAARAEADKLSVSCAEGVVTARIPDSNNVPAAGTYSFTVTPVLEGGTELRALTLRVSVAATKPTVSLASSTLRLNDNYSGETASSLLKLSLPGYTVTALSAEKASSNALTGEPISIWLEGGAVKARLAESVADGSYSYTLTPTVQQTATGQEKALAAMTLRVTVYRSASVSATVSASGKLDAINRDGSSITYTITRLNNISGALETPVLLGEDADKFVISEIGVNSRGQQTVKLSLKSGESYRANQAYKVQLGFAVDGVDELQITSPLLSVRVDQSALRLTASPTTVSVYQAHIQPLCFTVRLTTPEAARIGSVKVGPSTTLALQQALGAESVVLSEDGASAVVTVPIVNAARLKAGGSYTIVLEVTPIGAAESFRATQIRATVRAYK